jgi:CRISPR-associated endonuclease/helicase Cas3
MGTHYYKERANRMDSRLIAHVRRKEDGSWDVPHDLVDHLVEVAELAAGFAGAFGASEAAYAMGLAHDAGKSTANWQRYIRSDSGYQDEGGDHVD